MNTTIGGGLDGIWFIFIVDGAGNYAGFMIFSVLLVEDDFPIFMCEGAVDHVHVTSSVENKVSIEVLIKLRTSGEKCVKTVAVIA